MKLCDYGCGDESKYTLKNGKNCCSPSHNGCPSLRIKNSNSKRGKPLIFKTGTPTRFNDVCPFCDKKIMTSGMKYHKKFCYLNPINIKYCAKCGSPIKNYKNNICCSYKCSNNYFKEKQQEARSKTIISTNYRIIALKIHDEACIICGVNFPIAIHHYDGNHENNKIENLVPLCMNHHVIIHSNYKYTIEDKIKEYVENFIKENGIVKKE